LTQQTPGRTELEGKTQAVRRPYALLLALLAAVTLITGAGAWLYERESERVRAQKIEELESIAKLKVAQIISWRDERLMDAAFGAKGPFFVTAFTEWEQDRLDDAKRAEYEARLANYIAILRYDSSLLVSVDGRVALAGAGGDRSIARAERNAMRVALERRQPAMSEFFLLEGRGPRVSVVAAVFDGSRHLGYIVLRRNPENIVFPLLREWPTPSPSAETVLVTLDGDSMLFVNGLRHRDIGPLRLRIPMSNDAVAGVRALKAGRPVTLEGSDYRGVPVIARSEGIPGTSWVLGAKVDRDEILAESRLRGLAIVGFTLLGTLLAALAVALLYNRRQQRLFRNLFEAEQQRRREEDEFRTTVYSVSDGIITTDAAARVRRMNPAAEAMTGWQEQDARGEPCEAVLPLVDESTGATVDGPATRALKTNAPVGTANHTLLVARDGTRRIVASSAAPIRGDDESIRGVVIVFRDQTAMRRKERDLEEALRLARSTKQQLRGVIDATTDMIAAVDTDYRYLSFNRAYADEFRRIFGPDIKPGDSLLERLEHLPRERDNAKEIWGRALAGEQYTIVHDFGDPGRERKSFELAFSPIRDATGRIVGAVHANRDVTERTRVQHALAASEANLRRLNEDLERLVDERTRELVSARDVAEASNRIKDIFLATMSHELRTPLNSIIGFSDVLLSGIAGELNPEQQTQLGIINKSGQQLLALISDVLDISKIEAGQLTLHPVPLALVDLLQEQERMFDLQARERGLELRFDYPASPVQVFADPQRVRQVVGNLLSNALKYTDRGEAGLAVDVLDGMARITVFDSGIGIAAEDQDSLFKPFRRIAPKNGGTRDGTGLGLAISRRLVEAMGGRIGLTSEPGRGSRFWFTLPLA
jgi:PAS domain S-box-containing protein